MIKYLLMAVAIVFSGVNAGLLRSFAGKTTDSPYSSFTFNAGISVVWMAILSLWLVVSGDCSISVTSVIYGVVYGVILGLFLLFKMRATAEGPVSHFHPAPYPASGAGSRPGGRPWSRRTRSGDSCSTGICR